MTDNKLIESYILKCYGFTSNHDGFRIIDKLNDSFITLQEMFRFMDRMFPNMNTINIVSDWFQLNQYTVTNKIRVYLDQYKLVLGGRRLVWDVINGFGKSFDKNELYKLTPNHHKTVIDYIYDVWFREMSEVETKKLIGC
tara:strand:- start:286 stop:705 length:420 start_codon:yes stop_codon:yes gene_type:complete